MSIDPNDAPEGYVAMPETYDGATCSPCAFDRSACPTRGGQLMCVAENRPDGRYVIFIAEEERVD